MVHEYEGLRNHAIALRIAGKGCTGEEAKGDNLLSREYDSIAAGYPAEGSHD